MKLNMQRYHHKIFFPSNVGEMIQTFIDNIPDTIGYTNHANEEREADKRGVIPKATKEELFDSSNTVVEFYELLDQSGEPTGIIQKIVLRNHNNDKFDYTYVVAREGFVVSNWANDKNDEHRLNKSMHIYYSPTNEFDVA